ncbi:hypothetical protein BD779DRAFT_1567842 [Infundibulicybe gibba]|nr:hypothetical protein BD779DRAFT_1567842 [Infundibulicybe gibba]
MRRLTTAVAQSCIAGRLHGLALHTVRLTSYVTHHPQIVWARRAVQNTRPSRSPVRNNRRIVIGFPGLWDGSFVYRAEALSIGSPYLGLVAHPHFLGRAVVLPLESDSRSIAELRT